jgi:hypothetical protein
MAITRDNNARQSLLNNIPYFGIPLPHSLFWSLGSFRLDNADIVPLFI